MAMNLSFGNIVGLFRGQSGLTQSQVNQQIAQGGGNEVVRDRVVKDERKTRSMKLTGQKVLQKNMLDQAKATKAPKKG